MREVSAYVSDVSDPVAHDIPCISGEGISGEGISGEGISGEALIECSLCDTPCFEYPRFFMESQRSGYVWGRYCPRGGCHYCLCYPCVLRLPAPAFACPACRFEWADEVALPDILREWRESKDAEQDDFQQQYDLLFSEHSRLLARTTVPTDLLLRALVGRANNFMADPENGAISIELPLSDSEGDASDADYDVSTQDDDTWTEDEDEEENNEEGDIEEKDNDEDYIPEEEEEEEEG